MACLGVVCVGMAYVGVACVATVAFMGMACLGVACLDPASMIQYNCNIQLFWQRRTESIFSLVFDLQ